MRTFLKLAMGLGLVAAIAGTIYYFFIAQNLSNRETVLLSVFLTFVSFLLSWLITHYYAEQQYLDSLKKETEAHKNNLKMYANKAAEKVNNLSKELSRVGLYLKEGLDSQDTGDLRYDMLYLEGRVCSAVQMIDTLKSFNDTALSDWQGVIDDILEQRKKEEQITHENIMLLTKQLYEAEQMFRKPGSEQSSQEMLAKELQLIKSDLLSALDSMGVRIAAPRVPRAKPQQVIMLKCPDCGCDIPILARFINKNKMLTCGNCHSSLSATSTDGVISLMRADIVESVTDCPKCGHENMVSVFNKLGSSKNTICSNCGTPYSCHVSNLGVVASINQKLIEDEAYKENIIEQVRQCLPAQPWPAGVHQMVAKKLSLTPSRVSWAIHELIKRGIFMPQKDGVVLQPTVSN
jgi:transcription elongation factor Elf1